MGKRRHKKSSSHLREKIRRLEKRLANITSDDSTSDEESRHYEYRRSTTPTATGPYEAWPNDRDYSYILESSSEGSPQRVQSIAVRPSDDIQNVVEGQTSNETTSAQPEPTPSTSSATQQTSTPTDLTLPLEILEALGDPKSKDEVFGPRIQDEVAKRWGRVLVDGLSKEAKQLNIEKHLIPENFRLAKAPLLNPEISPVLSEVVKNRDKQLEKRQNHLGLGIAGLTYLVSQLIEGDLTKVDILKRISEISQIFLDLHHENTKNRRKLIISSLDKKFVELTNHVKRDLYLFGENLGEKIRTSKTAEKSGLQVRRHDNIPTHRHNQQGNWKGPPRSQGTRATRPGGQRYREPNYQSHRGRRPPPLRTERQPAAYKQSAVSRGRRP